MNASFVSNLIVYYKGETVECIINMDVLVGWHIK